MIPLLPAAAWLLKGTALTGLTAGAGTLAAGGVGRTGSALLGNKTIGWDADKVAEGENFDRASGKIKNWDRGDQFRSWVSGVSREDVTKKALEQSTAAIKQSPEYKTFQSLETRLKNLPGGKNLAGQIIQLGDTDTREELQRRNSQLSIALGNLEELNRREQLLGQKSTVGSFNINDPSSIKAASDALNVAVNNKNTQGSIEYQDLKKAEKERLRMHYQDRADRREDARLEREMLMLNANQDRDLRKFELEQGNRSRKAELFQALFGLGSAFMI